MCGSEPKLATKENAMLKEREDKRRILLTVI
jgi:hypothetical protein